MAYVPGYDYDLFISYARVDNEPLPSADSGWVDTFVKILTSGSGLAGKLGRRESFSWWMDEHNLRGNDEVNSHIPEQVRRSALMVVVLSPGYVSSTFCKQELQTFLDAQSDQSGRVFVINRAPLVERRHTMPPSLKTLRKYEFWEADKNNKPRILGWPQPIYSNPNDRVYYQRIEDVCQEIADKLDELRTQGPVAAAAPAKTMVSAPITPPPVAPLALAAVAPPAEAASNAPAPFPRQARVIEADKPRILLAETTDDLLRRREEVRRYLEQAGIEVLPGGTYYGLTAAEYERALAADLADAHAFVQLLGPELGRCVDGAGDGFGWLQYNVARSSQRPILQWRSLELADLKAVDDLKQHKLLQGAEAMPIEEFKLKILQSLAAARAKPKRPSFFFINCDSVDVGQADDIGSNLGGRIEWERPPFEDKPRARQLQESIESRLIDCDGLLIVHGRSPLGWVRAQLQLYRKLRQRRATEPRVLAVVQSGPAQKLAGIGVTGLKIIGVDHLPEIIEPELAR